MMHAEDPDQLKGVAASLENLFAQLEVEGDLPAAEDSEEPDLAEAPVPDAEIPLDEASGPTEEVLEQVDPEEELRVSAQAATHSLVSAVDGFVSGEGEVADLSQSIRDEAARLHEAGTLDPVVDAVERLVLVAPLDDPDHVAGELARSLATPAVSAGIAMRLAGARDEERREHLTQACR